jgi:hypothetical protein
MKRPLTFQAILCAVTCLASSASAFAGSATTDPQPQHPYYLHALSDLRASRWMLEHRPGNWNQTVDEVNAVQQIDAAIGEIKKASIDDGKNLEDHPPVDERNDHGGRLEEGRDLLLKARQDISHDEDNQFAQGLQGRAYMHIDAALNSVNKALQGFHPAYLHALSDLRAARWMIEHRPGNWDQTVDEVNAVQQIDYAIQEIKHASIEDGKNLEDHPTVDERNDHDGRLHEAVDFLAKARQDIGQDEDNTFAAGLQAKAYNHIDAAIASVKKAIHS